MNAAFVTGGSGFLGRELVVRLRKSGFVVRALVRSSAAAQRVQGLGAEPVHVALTDTDGLTRAMRGCQRVIHGAAVVGFTEPLAHFYETNVTGTEAVVAAAEKAGVRELVYVSAAAILLGSRHVRSADESCPLPPRPVGAYARTKAMAEQRVLAANREGFRTVSVRPPLIWGDGETGMVRHMCEAARSGKLAFIGGGSHLISTCHVDNAAEAILLAAERGRGGSAYFVTDGRPVELRVFVTALLATQRVDAGSRSIPRWLAPAMARALEASWWLLRRPNPPPFSYAMARLLGEEFTVDDSRARREIGYVGGVSLEKGLARMRKASSLELGVSPGATPASRLAATEDLS